MSEVAVKRREQRRHAVALDSRTSQNLGSSNSSGRSEHRLKGMHLERVHFQAELSRHVGCAIGVGWALQLDEPKPQALLWCDGQVTADGMPA